MSIVARGNCRGSDDVPVQINDTFIALFMLSNCSASPTETEAAKRKRRSAQTVQSVSERIENGELELVMIVKQINFISSEPTFLY